MKNYLDIKTALDNIAFESGRWVTPHCMKAETFSDYTLTKYALESGCQRKVLIAWEGYFGVGEQTPLQSPEDCLFEYNHNVLRVTKYVHREIGFTVLDSADAESLGLTPFIVEAVPFHIDPDCEYELGLHLTARLLLKDGMLRETAFPPIVLFPNTDVEQVSPVQAITHESLKIDVWKAVSSQGRLWFRPVHGRKNIKIRFEESEQTLSIENTGPSVYVVIADVLTNKEMESE